MSTPNLKNRPTSPFMFGSLYRWQISSVTSMIHRITGIGLVLSFMLLAFWIIGLGAGGGFASFMNALISSWFGKLVLFISIWAMWYHFCNGIRHLAWDMGFGFDLNTAARSGMLVIILSVALTFLTILVV